MLFTGLLNPIQDPHLQQPMNTLLPPSHIVANKSCECLEYMLNHSHPGPTLANKQPTSCISPLARRACEKVASDFLLGVFLLVAPVSSTIYNWLVTRYGNMAEK